MKSRPSLNRLLKHFLKTSPRTRTTLRNGILPPQHQTPLTKLPTDQQFIKNFIVHLDISYMYQYYGPLTVNQHKTFLQKKSFLNPLSNGLLRRKCLEIHSKQHEKQVILQQLIKQLNKDKYLEYKYTQCQQFIYGLTSKQVKQNKKLIVFLYKWTLTQKHKFQPESIYHQLCHQLCSTILQKIFSSHEQLSPLHNINTSLNTQNTSHTIPQQQTCLTPTKHQLLLINTLFTARQQIKQKNYPVALSQYSLVYFSVECEEIDRGQALQCICEICQKQSNVAYLENIAEKIKSNKNCVIGNVNYIEKVIIRIKDKIVKGKKQDQQKNYNKTEIQSQEEFFKVNNISLQQKQTIPQQSKQQQLQGSQQPEVQKTLSPQPTQQIIPPLTSQQPNKILLSSASQPTQKPSTTSPQNQLQSMIPPTKNNENNIQ